MFDISLIAWPGLGAFVGYTAGHQLNRYLDGREVRRLVEKYAGALSADDLAEPVARCVGGRARHMFMVDNIDHAICVREGCTAANPYRASEPVVATTEGQPMSEAAV